MKPSELYGVVVRTIGLLMVLSGAWMALVGTLTVGLGALIFGTLALSVGLWLLRGAESFVRFAYPQEDHDRQSSS